jgi:hypothetical protein
LSAVTLAAWPFGASGQVALMARRARRERLEDFPREDILPFWQATTWQKEPREKGQAEREKAAKAADSTTAHAPQGRDTTDRADKR